MAHPATNAYHAYLHHEILSKEKNFVDFPKLNIPAKQ